MHKCKLIPKHYIFSFPEKNNLGSTWWFLLSAWLNVHVTPLWCLWSPVWRRESSRSLSSGLSCHLCCPPWNQHFCSESSDHPAPSQSVRSKRTQQPLNQHQYDRCSEMTVWTWLSDSTSSSIPVMTGSDSFFCCRCFSSAFTDTTCHKTQANTLQISLCRTHETRPVWRWFIRSSVLYLCRWSAGRRRSDASWFWVSWRSTALSSPRQHYNTRFHTLIMHLWWL